MDARQAFDNVGDAGQSPEVRGVAVSWRSLPQSPIDPSPLGQTQLGFASGPAGGPQGVVPSALPHLVPPTDALPADVEAPSYLREDQLTRREQACGLFSPLFQSAKIPPWTVVSSHTISIRSMPPIVTILCEAQ